MLGGSQFCFYKQNFLSVSQYVKDTFVLCLKLVEQKEEGECKTECKTIEKACQEVFLDILPRNC